MAAPQQSGTLKVVPALVEICPGDAQAFTVEPVGTPVTWSVKPEIGKIDKDQGIYTAPKRVLEQRNLVVLAQVGNDFATAALTLNDGPHVVRFLGGYGVLLAALVCAAVLLFWSALAAPQRVPLVIVNPPLVTLDPLKSETFTFTATVLGDAKNAVTWSASGGKAIDANTGVYRHAANPNGQDETFTVRATNLTDPDRSGTAIVHLIRNEHREVFPQAVSAFPTQQVQFRTGDNSSVAWALSRRDLGEVSSSNGTFTVGRGIRFLEPIQINAWSAPPSRIVAAAAIVVNPPMAESNAGDWRILAFVMVMGALGSMLYFSSSFVSYVGNRTFRSTWFWFYISRPFVGGGLAVIFFFMVGSGMLGGTTSADLARIAMISALVGLFSDKAVKKLSDILDTVLATKDDRKDKVASQPQTASAPTITSAVPPTVAKGTATTIKLAGTNLANVKVKVNSRDAQPKDVSPTGFAVDLETGDTAGDKVTVTATTAGGTASFEVKTT